MGSNLTDEDRKWLLELARSVIMAKLKPGTKAELPQNLSPGLRQKQGCFVTLEKNGRLRGCIGTIEPVHSLFEGVKDNALNSAFQDSRFSPVKASELPDIKIEISVLTLPQHLAYTDAEDLRAKLKPGVHGVILSKGFRRATFLPQVWEQLPNTDDFLAHLCRKAGMDADCWKKGDAQIQIYEVEHFSE
jgi:AmmeMemoRadiSam system protein A